MSYDKFGKVSGVAQDPLEDLSAGTPDTTTSCIPFIDATDSHAKKDYIEHFFKVINSYTYGLADDAGSLFVLAGTHNFSGVAAVNTDLGAIGVKCDLVGGMVILTQVLNAGATSDATITVSKLTGGSTPVATALTVTKANTSESQSNFLGATRGLAPVAAGAGIAYNAHIWVCSNSDATRSTGKAIYWLVFRKVS
jgi:hypothetical protein